MQDVFVIKTTFIFLGYWRMIWFQTWFEVRELYFDYKQYVSCSYLFIIKYISTNSKPIISYLRYFTIHGMSIPDHEFTIYNLGRSCGIEMETKANILHTLQGMNYCGCFQQLSIFSSTTFKISNNFD